ncbi:MAG: hypothetical protein ABIJ48_09245 [Actinomycetota bacterium]
MASWIDRNGAAVTAGFAAVWLVAAWLVDDTTFHLGPVLVAGAAPFLATRRRLNAWAFGLGAAVLVGVVLLAAGRLDGPSLLPWGGALLETVVGAVAGGLAGLVGGARFPAGRGS